MKHLNPSPTEYADFLQESGITKNDIKRYWQKFFDTFTEKPDHLFSFDEVASQFGVGAGTVKSKLKNYLRFYPEHLQSLIGFYPSVDAIIDLAIKKTGSLRPDNVVEINVACKKIVDSITWPMHDDFIRSSLENMGTMAGDRVDIDYKQLAQFMYDDYSEFLTGSDNGRISIAGRMNEEILLRALTAAGLERDATFSRTGKDSEADIQLYHQGRRRITLFCEVKSYKARERFLRGLRDIPHTEKIGAGFFIDATEFNPTRTRKLLETTPKAIYLPQKTFEHLHPDSLQMTTHLGNRLYRPLESFATDMVDFVKNGEIPDFR